MTWADGFRLWLAKQAVEVGTVALIVLVVIVKWAIEDWRWRRDRGRNRTRGTQ